MLIDAKAFFANRRLIFIKVIEWSICGQVADLSLFLYSKKNLFVELNEHSEKEIVKKNLINKLIV